MMYVKIVNGANECIYECDRFLMHPKTGTFTESMITLETDDPSTPRKTGTFQIHVDRTTSDIYVMNDRGRTIEVYRASA